MEVKHGDAWKEKHNITFCKNCKYQIEPLRNCEAAENGAFCDRVYFLIEENQKNKNVIRALLKKNGIELEEF